MFLLVFEWQPELIFMHSHGSRIAFLEASGTLPQPNPHSNYENLSLKQYNSIENSESEGRQQLVLPNNHEVINGWVFIVFQSNYNYSLVVDF